MNVTLEPFMWMTGIFDAAGAANSESLWNTVKKILK